MMQTNTLFNKFSVVLEPDVNVYERQFLPYKGRTLKEGDEITVINGKIVLASKQPTHIITSCKGSECETVLMLSIVDLKTKELSSLRIK